MHLAGEDKWLLSYYQLPASGHPGEVDWPGFRILMLQSQTLVAQTTITMKQCMKSKMRLTFYVLLLGKEQIRQSEDLGGTPPAMSLMSQTWGLPFIPPRQFL